VNNHGKPQLAPRPFQGGLPLGLGPTDPCPSTVHMETYSASVLCVLKQSNRYYHQDLHWEYTLARRLTPNASSRAPRRPTRSWLILRLPEDRRTIGPLSVHPASPILLTKNGPLGPSIQAAASMKKATSRANLEFGNRLRKKFPSYADHLLYLTQLV